MVPTAEVPLTGLHMGDIFEDDMLPRYYTAYTPCFRREKMSAGRDVRGIKRGHQFDKVEMYIYSRPEESQRALEKMLADAEQTCTELGLTYRILQLCTGDLGFNAGVTYDIEVWAPGCGEWLEVSSVSNDTDFQARRANIKYRPKGEKTLTIGAYLEWFRSGHAAHDDCHTGELPAGGWIGGGAGGAAPVDGWH